MGVGVVAAVLAVHRSIIKGLVVLVADLLMVAAVARILLRREAVAVARIRALLVVVV